MGGSVSYDQRRGEPRDAEQSDPSSEDFGEQESRHISRMPAKLLLNIRAIATAGFANDVEAVNQYAEVILAATS